MAPPVERPHGTSLAVWDVASPAEQGATVSVKVGARCDSACNIEGSKVEVLDSEGRVVSEGVLGKDPFPGTEALFWTQLDFAAPAEIGFHAWSVRLLESRLATPHAKAEGRLGFMVVGTELYSLEVTVSDGNTKARLAGAYVRVGASTLFTDDGGAVLVSVPKGAHELVVWKRDHKMSRGTVEVPVDTAINVELIPSPCKYCPDST